MGMSASQARFLCLTARKNNVEFEGQQINQQRMTLSDQSANYYSELCNMSVPTPPSIDDYTKVSYTFDDGALTNTITSMIAKGNGDYSISYIQQWQDDYSIVAASSSIISQSINIVGNTEYKIGSTTLRKLGDINGYNMLNDPYLSTLSEEQLNGLMEEENYYQVMLNETVNNNPAANNEWYVRYVKDSTTGSYTPFFYQASAVENESNYTEGFATSNINCYSLGSTTRTKEILSAPGTVEKDSTGRYISITLYNQDDEGNVDKNSSVTYTLITNTATDEEAYNDAMNQYNYNKAKYDQDIEAINAKIEIIQGQDKNLELRLKQLDTEQKAIQTEMDAVQKVIEKNTESTFKTFG